MSYLYYSPCLHITTDQHLSQYLSQHLILHLFSFWLVIGNQQPTKSLGSTTQNSACSKVTSLLHFNINRKRCGHVRVLNWKSTLIWNSGSIPSRLVNHYIAMYWSVNKLMFICLYANWDNLISCAACPVRSMPVLASSMHYQRVHDSYKSSTLDWLQIMLDRSPWS